MSAMPSIRLNNELRDTFITKVIQEICPQTSLGNPLENLDLGQKLLDEVYKEEHKILLAKLPSLFQNTMLEKTNRLSGFYFKTNSTEYLRKHIQSFTWHISEQRIPNAFADYTYYYSNEDKDNSLILPYNHWASEMLRAYDKDLTTKAEQRSILKNKLEQLLNSVNSSRQLFNAWPDAIKYKHHLPIPEHKISRAQRVQNKPAVSAEDINLTVKLATSNYKQNI